MGEERTVRLRSGQVGAVVYQRPGYRVVEYADGTLWTIQCWARSGFVPRKAWGDLASGFTSFAEARDTVDMYVGDVPEEPSPIPPGSGRPAIGEVRIFQHGAQWIAMQFQPYPKTWGAPPLIGAPTTTLAPWWRELARADDLPGLLDALVCVVPYPREAVEAVREMMGHPT